MAGGAMLMASAAQAQTVPQTAPTREQIERQTRQDEPPGQGRVTITEEFERAPCALDRPEYRDIRFTLSDVLFNELRGLDASHLRPAFERYLGQEIPVATICEIRDRAATILRNAGYIASVEVPEQRIADGTVRFQVLMARLVGLRVRGEAGRSERVIRAYLERLTRQEVFNRFDAERYLLLAGDVPGYDVRLALRSAGGAPGEVIGEIALVRTPAAIDLNVQNYGSRELGRFGALLRGQFHDLTGLGDRTTIGFFTTPDFQEQQTLQVAHDFRVGSDGLTLGGQLTYAWARPDLGDPTIDFDSRTLFATLEASYPIIRRQEENLRGSVGLDIVNQDLEFGGIEINRDRLRVAFARLGYDTLGYPAGDTRYSAVRPMWGFSAYAEARVGLDLFGASEACGPLLIACQPPVVPPSRAEGDATAASLRAGLLAEVRPDPRFTVAVGVRGQYSGDALFAFEEFSGGNYTIGRGYDPGAIIGDSGLGFQAELRYGDAVPIAPDQFAFEPFVFLDQVWAWNEDRIFPIPRQELTSVGGGVRAAYGDRFRLEVTLVAPLDRTLTQPDRDPRLLISFTTRLWPWSFR
jgi:hemolysin activation/secretion protein